MTHLALDLGTTAGYCVGRSLESVSSGDASFKPARYDGGGMRYLKFRAWLDQMRKAFPDIERVYFEEVRRHAGTDAAHVYGGLMATLTSWCEENKLPYEGVPVGQIKKHATGRGNASKGEVIAAVNEWGFATTSDNEADAIALWHLRLCED